MAEKKRAAVRPMSVLGWEIATTLPSSTGATVDLLVEDCVYHPWFAPAQPGVPYAEARKAVASALAHEIRPFVDRLAGLGALSITKGKRAGAKRLYRLTPIAQRKVGDEFEKVAPALRLAFSGKES